MLNDQAVCRDTMRSTARCIILFKILIFICLFYALPAYAKPPAHREVEGVIVQVDKGEVIVDLGSDVGLTDSATVSIFRRLEVKHPVSGQVIIDRFFIGTLKLQRVGKLLSIAKDYSHLERPPAMGDFVVFTTDEALPAPQNEALVPYHTPAITADPAQETLNTTFNKTLGQPIEERIELWIAYLQDQPGSPFAERVAQEVVWLRRQLELSRKDPPPVPKKPNALTARASISNNALEGEPIEVYAAVVEVEHIEAVRALARPRGGIGYTTIPMQRDGDFGWRATLEAPWNSPGVVEFMVEAIRTDGTSELIVGSTSSPVLVDVLGAAHDIPDERERSRATSTFDYVDFWISGDAKDAYLRFESDYRYTVGSPWLSTIAVGVGVFDGSGNSLAALEDEGLSRGRNISYGSIELGFDFGQYVGLTARISFGNGRRDENAEREAIFGLRSALRIGRDNGTRLILGGNFTEDIGNEGWVEFVLEELPKIPIHASVVATNLPVGEDIGVSLNAGVGYRVHPLFTVMTRVGWNARTINHWGLTGGLSAILTW